MDFNILAYAFSSLAFLGVSYIIGHSITWKCKTFNFGTLFIKHLLGAIIVLSIYAIIKTHGQTIYLSVFALTGLLVFLLNSENGHWVNLRLSDFNAYHMLLLLIVFSCIYSLYQFNISGLRENMIGGDLIDSDIQFWANISYYIEKTGQENEYHALNLLDRTYHGTSPYHYFELWMNAFISSTFQLNYFLGLALTVKSILTYLIFLGLTGLVEQYFTRKKNVAIFIATLILFGGAIPFGHQLLNLSFFSNLSFNGPVFFGVAWKESVNALFLILFFLFYSYKKKELSVLSLLLLGAINFTPFPAIFGGLTLFFLLGALFNSERRKYYLRGFIVVFGLLIIYAMNLYVFKNHEITREGTGIESLRELILGFDTDFLVNAVKGMFGFSAILFFTYAFHIIPVLLFVVLNFKWIHIFHTKHEDVVLMILMIVSGVMCYGLLHNILNATQLLFGLAIPGIALLIMRFYSVMLTLKCKKILLVPLVLLLACSYFLYFKSYTSNAPSVRYSPAYIASVKDFLSDQDQPIGVSFRSNYYSPYSGYTYIYTHGDFLALLKNGAFAISLSDLGAIPKWDEIGNRQFASGVSSGIFVRQVQAQKDRGTFISEALAQRDFIISNDIRYGIMDNKYPLSEEVKSMVTQKIVDPISHQVFLIF
ncbi:MAG: hypothetical protein JXR07_20060 [Reichenbachiella sp.]